MDIFDKAYNWTEADLAREMGLYPYFLPLQDTEGTEVIVDDRKILMIGSNNYLGLTTDPRVREAAIEAVKRYGTSCTGSRFLNGTLALHQEAEARLADYVGMEAALGHHIRYHRSRRRSCARQGRPCQHRRRRPAGPRRSPTLYA